jgi:acetylglutamate kinase
LVGDVARVNPDVLEPLLARGYVPVISSVAANLEGESHNINADTVAGELAAALEAEKLILLTDTQGILRDRDNPDSLIRQLRLSEARQLIHEGVVAGGMTPKTECCIRALAQGVAAAHIVDGRVPHALLLEVFTDAGIGTMVLGRG